MSGTTTFARDGANATFASYGLGAGDVLEVEGMYTQEPSNPADSNAIAVLVDGRRVGYLPGHLAGSLAPSDGERHTCQVQLWAGSDQGHLRVIGWVAPGHGPVAWPYAANHPPVITAGEQRQEHAAATRRMVTEALTQTDNPDRNEAFRRGMVGSIHYLETVEPIKRLKREDRLDEALALCYGAIAAAENARDGREPAPWYTEQAAMIHRKRGERDREVAVLQRWLAVCPEERRATSKIQLRLDKLLG